MKIYTQVIASYHLRRSLWGIITQTNSFLNFSDLTLKATFIIFLEKNFNRASAPTSSYIPCKKKKQTKNNFENKTAAKSSKQDLSSDFWKTFFFTISNISFLRFDFLANSCKN